jgi:type I restriction enzyme S subunit
MNAPKLRFKEFDGEWKEKKLTELYQIKNGLNKEKEAFGSGTPIVNYMDVNKNTSLLLNDIKGKVQLTSSEKERFSVKSNDLFFTRTSETSDEIGLTCTYIGEDTDLAFSGFILKATPINPSINSLFYSYYLRSGNSRKEIIKHSSITTRALTSGTLLSQMSVAYPMKAEQKKIADFFALIDKRVQKQQEKVELLRVQKKGLMQKIFSQEIRFKDEDGGEFPKWNSFLFGNVVSNKSDKVNPEDGSDLNMCIELANIESGSGRIVKDTNYIDQTSMKNKFSKGSVLFGKLRPYLKKFWFSNSEGMCSTEIWVLSPSVFNLKKKYLYYFIQTEYFMEFANKSSGSKMPRADWNIISNMKFKIPTIKEQQKISDFFSILDSKIENENNKIESLKKQKKGFMQQMFV